MAGLDTPEQAKRALDEIERLVRAAEADGVALDPWIGELADELRALAGPAAAAALARRMAGDPRLSLVAQSRAPGTTRLQA